MFVAGPNKHDILFDRSGAGKSNTKRNSERNGKRPRREGEARDDEIETSMIQALAPLHNTLYSEELISKTNDYNQTLAHFAVLFGYSDLLRQLLGWNIDISIADVNGFTALHCAYKRGHRACVALLLDQRRIWMSPFPLNTRGL